MRRFRGSDEEVDGVLHEAEASLFQREPSPSRSHAMATIEELIQVLLPLLPDAEVSEDNDG